MSKEFEGKVVLVTGGSSGIGRETAIAFGRQGAKVAVTSRREKEGLETVELIKAAGGEGLYLQSDVSQEEQIKEAVARVISYFGSLDCAFNNAGVEEEPGPYLDKTQSDFDRVFNINVKGVWLSMKYEIPEMLKHGKGSIVNMSSIAGLIGMGMVTIYIASKHAVTGFTKSAALEYAKSGIRINEVNPGGIKTEMFERFSKGNQDFVKMMEGLHPMGRLGEPLEIAEAVLWLSSDKASFVTGHSLVIDGGFVAA
ncbi:MAG: SDR family oxidoreductase [Candidatus Caenarcaniphilales bacterium]|nr:SDR family oxidoreductase [Candidatus Caenarcaniphilales bacterium]